MSNSSLGHKEQKIQLHENYTMLRSQDKGQNNKRSLTFCTGVKVSSWYNFKGALDKYDIYLFISNSIEDFKLNQYQKFQLILSMRFHFMRYFVNSIISRVSHRLLHCVFIEVDFEK